MNPNGDATDDVVVAAFLDTNNETSGDLTVNALSLLRGIEQLDADVATTGFFQTDLEPQVHPVSHDWSGFDQSVVADINGDGRDDLVWIDGGTGETFVAYGKPDAFN